LITVICVLRSGGIYTPEWVSKLSRGVERNLSLPHCFVCLTDMRMHIAGVQPIRLPEGWPGWWSKICLFHPDVGLAGPTLYFDLDTLIVGSLDGIAAHPHGFTMAHEYYRPARFCSTAMAWSGDHSEIWRQMKADPERVMREYRSRADGRIGDQAFIEDVQAERGIKIDAFRDLFGEVSIASFKVHARSRIPAGAAAVAFHGKPKPPEAIGWAQKMWEAA
jgi:hypothetical protein